MEAESSSASGVLSPLRAPVHFATLALAADTASFLPFGPIEAVAAGAPLANLSLATPSLAKPSGFEASVFATSVLPLICLAAKSLAAKSFAALAAASLTTGDFFGSSSAISVGP